MSRARIGLLGVGFGLLIACAGQANAQARPGEAQPAQPRQRGFGGGQIITADEMSKLDLSAEQKEKLEKIVKEYTEATDTLRPRANDNFREAFEKVQKARTEAVDKVKAVLKDDQKKKFDELVQARRPGGGFGIGGASLGKVLPDAAQTRLELTSEQKAQLEKLQKKVDDELNKILTEAQRKQFEEMKSRPSGGVRPGGTERPGGGTRPERPGRDTRPARPANP